MPTVKDFARAVVEREWGVTSATFEALWDTLASIPRQTTPLMLSSDDRAHALAAAGAIAEPPEIAVFIFTQAQHEFPNAVTWEQLSTKLTEIANLLGYKGEGKRITADGTLSTSHEARRPKAAMMWADDTGDGIADTTAGVAIDQQTADDAQKRRSKYAIFIYHRPGLPEHIVGQIYFKGIEITKAKPLNPAAQEPKRQHLTITEYRILTYVLKHRNSADECTIEDLIQHCFRDQRTAAELRNRDLCDPQNLEDYREDTKKHRATIGDLSTLLQYYVGSALRSGKTKKYGLIPWCTYCLIEKPPAN